MKPVCFELPMNKPLESIRWNDIPDTEWEDQCWAIIANNNGQGCVLAYGGGATLRYEIEEVGYHALDDLGLDDAPEGISVWEGRYDTTGGIGCLGYYDDSIETQPIGRFRPLTKEEWSRLSEPQDEGTARESIGCSCEGDGCPACEGKA